MSNNNPIDFEMKLKWQKKNCKKENKTNKFLRKKKTTENEKTKELKPLFLEYKKPLIVKKPLEVQKILLSTKKNLNIFIYFLLKLPYIIFEFTYLFYNTILSFLSLFLILYITWLFLRDVKAKRTIRKEEIKNYIKKCKFNYKVNRCEDLKLPALLDLCNEWEIGMYRNINTVEHFKIMGEVLGELIDQFINQLSYRSLIFIIIIFFIHIVLKQRRKN